MVEREPSKLGVAGSSPVSRSKTFLGGDSYLDNGRSRLDVDGKITMLVKPRHSGGMRVEFGVSQIPIDWNRRFRQIARKPF